MKRALLLFFISAVLFLGFIELAFVFNSTIPRDTALSDSSRLQSARIDRDTTPYSYSDQSLTYGFDPHEQAVLGKHVVLDGTDASTQAGQPSEPAPSQNTHTDPENKSATGSQAASQSKTIPCQGGYFPTDFLCLVNAYRTSNHKSILTYHANLNTVAQVHGTWMQNSGTFSHTGKDGTSYKARCTSAGTQCTGENLAQGFSTPQNLLALWQASPAHNKNLLGNYHYLGLGLTEQYAVALFQ